MMKLDRETARQIDALFSEWARYDSPGASLAVVRDGDIIYSQGYGMANMEYDVPNSPSTIFHVASVSKQFTAMAIVLLAQEGKLSIDDDIRDYLPEVPDFGRRITIRHLAHHVSGLRDQWELLRLAGWRSDDVITQEHIMKTVARQRDLNFEPGDQYLYCNTGYTLLAEIVSRLSGQSFADFTRDHIFRPLGMASTHVHDNHELIVKNRAYSYAPNKDGFKNQVLSFANVGATSLFTTVEDLARWITNFHDKRVGGPAGIEQLQERFTLNNGETIDYALGIRIAEFRGRRIIDHSGSDAGFRSHLMIFPDENLGIVVLSNLGTFAPGRIIEQVASIILEDRTAPEDSQADRAVEPVAETELPGIYHSPYTLAISIESGEIGLTASGGGLDRAPLIRQPDGTYIVGTIPYRVTPSRSADGQLRLVVAAGRLSLMLTRVDAPVQEPNDLDEYVGDYYSPELETTYHIVAVGNKLVVRHHRHPDLVLVAIGEDQFASTDWRFGDVQFEHGADRSIVGFTVSGGRVRNLRFKRFTGLQFNRAI